MRSCLTRMSQPASHFEDLEAQLNRVRQQKMTHSESDFQLSEINPHFQRLGLCEKPKSKMI